MWILLIYKLLKQLFFILISVQIQPSVTFANGSCNSIDSNTSNPSTLSEKSKESEVQGKEKDGTESLEDYKCHTRLIYFQANYIILFILFIFMIKTF